MTNRINTILIIGATSGLGEAFARRFHSMGKAVIITGRRANRLAELEKELPGIHTRQWDISDISSLATHVSELLSAHPNLDTIFINAGIQKSFSLLDASSTTTEDILSEVNINLTAPILISRAFLPHLLSRAETGKFANLLLTSSSIGYTPLPFYPIYCPTKAAVHTFTINLRQQLSFASQAVRDNLSVVEVVPPYVDTGLDAAHRDQIVAMQGGPDKAFPPMPLKEYIDELLTKLEETDDKGKLKKEIGVGFGQMGVDTWRESVGKMLEGMGINC